MAHGGSAAAPEGAHSWLLGRTGCPASSTTAIATLKPSAWALVKPRSMHARARVSVSVMAVSSGDFHPDLAGFDAGRIAGDAVAAPGQDALARPDVVHPAVPRTREPHAREPALGERTALVRAGVLAGEDVVPHARQAEAEPVRLDERRPARRNVVQAGHPERRHATARPSARTRGGGRSCTASAFRSPGGPPRSPPPACRASCSGARRSGTRARRAPRRPRCGP